MYDYDENNNRIAQTDANGNTTTMQYDELNRMISRTYPNGDQERFGYDENGNTIYKVSGTASAGDSTSFEYDSRNREVYRWYSNSGHTVETKYTADSKRDTVIDHRGMTTYEWGDCCSQLVRIDNPDNTFIEYEYDENKNKTAIITPWSRTEYTYDELNCMDSVISPDAGVTEYFYNDVGNRDSVHNANGTNVGYNYDNLNRLTKVTNYAPDQSVISSYTYELNNAGIRTAVNEYDGSRVDYGYDDLYRLTSETRTGTNAYSISYTYDQVGNRASKNHDGAITNYEYNNRDQLLTETTPAQTIQYTYDNSGRTETKTDSSGLTTYSWIDNDRMSSVVTPTQTLFYEYDIDGIKTKLDNGTNVSNYLIDKQQPYAQVIAEYDAASSLTCEYVFGLERISQERSGIKSTYLADGQGSIRQLTDNTGTVSDTYDYFAFGELLNRTGSTVNEFQYVGEQFDPNVGFYYLRARWMNPENGRFASSDHYWPDITKLAGIYKCNNKQRKNTCPFSELKFNNISDLSSVLRVGPNDYLNYLRFASDNSCLVQMGNVESNIQLPSLPLFLNRYLYANSSPVDFTDPSGELLVSWGISKVIEADIRSTYYMMMMTTIAMLAIYDEIILQEDPYKRHIYRQPIKPGKGDFCAKVYEKTVAECLKIKFIKKFPITCYAAGFIVWAVCVNIK